MPPTKGSVIVADGNGKVTIIEPPQNNNEVFVFDATEPRGGKFINIKNLLPNNYFKSSATSENSTNTSTYITIMSLTVLGESVNQIKNIKVLSYLTGSTVSYDVRIFDSTNSLTIAEKNFSNSTSTINDMGTLLNLPLGEAILEVQVKKNGGNNNSYAFLLEATIEYRNI